MSANSKLNVLEMAKGIATNESSEIKDLFVKKEQTSTEPQSDKSISDKRKPWSPDAATMESMPELNSKPVSYAKSEIKMEEDKGLKNISDDNAMQASLDAKDDLQRKEANIEAAKRRHNIFRLHIPEGPYQVAILAAAGDTNYERAQKGIDEQFEQIKAAFPEWIEYYTKEETDKVENKPADEASKEQSTEKPHQVEQSPQYQPDQSKQEMTSTTPTIEEGNNEETVNVVIDKSQAPTVAWSNDEIEKIKKSRKVQLNIVETKDIEYSQITDADDNIVDAILAPYVRKSNDIVGVLPASKYRATFTGLSYPEVIDLSNSQELNNLDGERKKWSIAYNHIKNPSIGEWEEYNYYIDQKTGKKVKLDIMAPIPEGVDPNSIHYVSKFDDFLSKTSFMDLDFILWKVLDATTMTEEIIAIDCHSYIEKTGKECGHSYDWVYRPSDLLIPESIPVSVLEDMKQAAEASSREKIMEIYNSSMLNVQNTVTLTTSGFKVIFGHISAYEYLNGVYGAIEALKKSTDTTTVASRSLNYATMTIIKAFLIPDPNHEGCYIRIKGVNNLMKVIDQLDEIDWQTLTELVRIMIEPYQFRYALRDIVCPKCKNRSMIPIENMDRLLFIVARSLSSVTVELKKI